MQAEQSFLDRIKRKQLKWYGHLVRMEDSPWSKKTYPSDGLHEKQKHGRRYGRI